MKKIILMFFISLTLGGFAQTSVYHPFPESNATWNVFWDGGFFSVCMETFSYNLSGDTVISNLTYHKIEVPYIQNLGLCVPFHPTGYSGCIRQDTSARKVYYLAPDSSNEELLYDFNLQVGDSIPGFLRFNCFTTTLAILEIDSVLIGTNYRKRWTTGHAFPGHSYNRIIEGIGFETGLLQQCPEGPGDAAYYTLTCFQQNGITLYPDTQTNCLLIDDVENLLTKSTIEIFPNPFKNFLTIKSKSNETLDVIIYDIALRKLQQQAFVQEANLNTEALSKGVYIYEIRNGSGELSRGKVIKD